MKKMKTRMLSCLIIVLMIVSLVPASTFATEATTMSEEFKAILNEDGKFAMDSVKPTSEDEAYWFFNETEFMMEKYPDFRFDSFSEDYSSCEIMYKFDWSTGEAQESHRVDIVYNYDSTIKEMVDEIVKNLPKGEEDRPYYFAVKDMELVNWWLNSGEINTLIDYSGELKEYFDYKNFVIDCRMGMDADFYTSAQGYAPFMYNGVMYSNVEMGVKAEHVIYVPDETGDSVEELMEAAQKRINEYIGEGKAEIIDYGEDIFELLMSYYDEAIANYNEEIAIYESNIEDLNAQIDELKAEKTEYQALIDANYEKINEIASKLDDCNNNIPLYSDYVDSYNMSINDCNTWIEEYNNQIAVLEDEIAYYETEIENLNAQIATSTDEAEIVQCEEDIANYESLIGTNNTLIAQYETERAPYIENVSEYEALRDECAVALAQYQADQVKYEADYNQYIDEINTYDQQISVLDESIMNCESTISSEEFNVEMAEMNRQWAMDSKQYETESYYEENGFNYFLQQAEGDYYFVLSINDMQYGFIIVKDSDSMITPEYKSSDAATDVSVESTDTSIPLDTQISVDKMTDGDEYDEIIDMLDVEESETFDIKLFSNSLGDYITKLANGKFQVKIPIGATWKDKSLVVYYVDQNKEIHEYKVAVIDEYAAFETDHFSIYTLAEKSASSEVQVNEGEAEITEDIIDEAITNAGDSETVALPLGKVSKEVTSVKLPVTSLGLVSEIDKALTVETALAKLSLDAKALKKIVLEAGEELSVTLAVDEIKEEVLTIEQKAAIKDKRVEMLISAEIICNNKLISDFGGGRITVQIPFMLEEGAMSSDYQVLHIADDGMVEKVDTTYDEGYFVLELEHFSEYAIVKTDTVVDNVQTGDSANMWLWVMILGISVSAVGCTAYISKKRA